MQIFVSRKKVGKERDKSKQKENVKDIDTKTYSTME